MNDSSITQVIREAKTFLSDPKVFNSGDLVEIDRKIALLKGTDTFLTNRINELTKIQTSGGHVDTIALFNFRRTLKSNEELINQLEATATSLRGSAADKIAIDRRLQQYADQVAQLQSLLDSRGRESDQKIKSLQTTIQSYQEQERQHLSDIESKTNQLSSLKETAQRLEKQNPVLEQNIETLTQQLEQAKSSYDASLIQKTADVNNAQSQIQRLQSQIQQLQSQIQQLQSQIDLLKLSEQNSRNSIKDTETAKAQAELVWKAAEQRLTEQIKKENDQLQVIQNKYSSELNARQQAENRLNSLLSQKKISDDKLELFNKQELDHNRTISESMIQISNLQQEEQKLKQRVSELETERAAALQQISNHSELIKDGESRRSDLETKYNLIQTQLSESKNENRVLTDNKNAIEQELALEKSNRLNCEANISTLQNQLTGKTNELEAQKARVGLYDSQIQTTQTRQADLEKQLTEARQQLVSDNTKNMEILSQYEKRINDAKTQINLLTSQRDNNILKQNELDSQLSSIKQQLSQRQDELSKSTSSISDLITKLQDAKEKYQEQMAQNVTLLSDKKQLISQFDTVNEQLSNSGNRIQELSDKNSQLTLTLQSVQEQLNGNQLKLSGLQKELEDTREALSSAVESKAKCTQNLSELQLELLETKNNVDTARSNTAEVSRQTEQIRILQQQLQQTQADNTKRSKAYDDQIQNLQTQLQTSQTRMANVQIMVNDLQQKMEKYASQENEVTQKYQLLVKERDQLKEELIRKGAEINQKQIQIAQLNKQIIDQQNQIRTIQAELAKGDETNLSLADLKRKKEECDEKYERLIEQVKRLTEERDSLKPFINTSQQLQQKYSELQNQADALKKSHQEEVSKFKSTVAELNKELGLSKVKEQQLQQIVEQTKSSSNATESQIQNQITEKNRLIEQLKEQVDSTKKEQVELNEKLQADLKKAIETASSLQQEVSSNKASEQTLSKQKNQFEEALKEAKRQQTTIQSELEQQRQKNKQLEQAEEKSRQQMEQLVKQLNEQTSLVSEKNDTIQSLRQSIEQLKPTEEPIAVPNVTTEEVPATTAEVSDFLVTQVKQDQIIGLLDKQLDVLKNALKSTLTIYKQLVDKSMEFPFRIDEIAVFGDSGNSRKNYILCMVFLFHTWRTIIRLPYVIRDTTNPAFSYSLPTGDLAEKFTTLLIPAGDTLDLYNSKVQSDGTMRIDLLIYFIIFGLVNKKDLQDSDVEFQDLFTFFRQIIEYTKENLPKVINVMSALTGSAGSSLRLKHNLDASRIVTFVRMSADDPSAINERFKLSITDQTLGIEWDDTPIPYYAPVKDAQNRVVDYTKVGPAFNYRSQYLFGPFTKVYEAKKKNADIAGDTTFRERIELPLRKGIPVTIIGYGASGSGKTTTLVYANIKTVVKGQDVTIQENGILLLLADRLAKDANFNNVIYKGYTKCLVALYELEADTNARDPANKAICHRYPGEALNELENTKPLKDNRPAVVDVLKDGTRVFEDQSYDYSNCDSPPNARRFEYTYKGNTWKNSEGKGIDVELLKYIDKSRSIAPSPNNPQSSRSHVICVLTFVNDSGDLTTLIVCDFAGVENKFNCTDQAVLDKIGVPTLVEIEKKRIVSDGVKAIQEKSLSDKITNAKLVENSGDKTPYLNPDNYINMDNLCNQLISNFKSIALTGDTKIFYANAIDPSPVKDKITKAKSAALDLMIPEISGSDKFTVTSKDRKGFKDISTSAKAFELITYVSKTDKSKDFKTIYANLVKLYQNAVKDKLDLKDPTVAELCKLVVWFKKDFKAYDLLYHSILTKKITEQNSPGTEPTYLIPESDITNQVKVILCSNRVKEGLFINRSLQQLRGFIAATIQKTTNGRYAPFIDQCVPLQCDPYVRDCFGKNDFSTASAEPSLTGFGPLVQYIMNVPHSDKMIFSIMNVVNLSKRANNPPPSPYFDISDLMYERERMKTYLPPSFNEDDRSLQLSHNTIPKPIFERILNSPLFRSDYGNNIKGLPKEVVDAVTEIIKGIYSGKYRVQDKMDELVDIFVNSNAITALGTMDFTDGMAKYGAAVTTCNLRFTKLNEKSS